jgi:MFS family permease
LIALGVAAVAATIFLFMNSTAWLFPARILSGLAIALASGASTAWILELHPAKENVGATQITIAANLLGLGLGALIPGVLAQFATALLRLSYFVFLVFVVPTAVLIWNCSETIAQAKSLPDARLKPRLGVPRQIRTQFVVPALGAFATFSVLGFYTALIPSLLENAFKNKNHAVAGGVVAELFLVGTASVLLTPNLKLSQGTFDFASRPHTQRHSVDHG